MLVLMGIAIGFLCLNGTFMDAISYVMKRVDSVSIMSIRKI